MYDNLILVEIYFSRIKIELSAYTSVFISNVDLKDYRIQSYKARYLFLIYADRMQHHALLTFWSCVRAL